MSRAIDELLADLLEESALPARIPATPLEIEPLWQVIVDCDSEASQRTVYEDLRRAGRTCRLLTLY